MKMMFAIIAMLLSTASARTLKAPSLHSCDEDYQAPNYWGKCVDGYYRNTDRYWNGGGQNEYADCALLVILVSQDSVGDKTLTVEFDENEGFVRRNSTGNALQINDFGYHSLIINQQFKGPDINVRFFLDGTKVHEGNYQQNYCLFEAGAIHTNDPNARTYEGSFGVDMPGHVITSF